MVGPLPPSKGGVRFVVIVMDYSTKLVKAKALETITAKTTSLDSYERLWSIGSESPTT